MLAPKNTLLQRNNSSIEGCIPKLRTRSYFDRCLREDLEKQVHCWIEPWSGERNALRLGALMGWAISSQ